MARIRLSFQGPLNALLEPQHRGRVVALEISPDKPLRHLIETCGVPHTEVSAVLDGSRMVSLERPPPTGAELQVLPWSADHPQLSPGDAIPRFVADAHLGRLAHKLRLLGFDTLFANDPGDVRLAALAAEQGRVLLSRDRQLLMRAQVAQGCYVADVALDQQLADLVARFSLCHFARPFTRCMECNGLLSVVALEELTTPPAAGVQEMQDAYWQCDGCGKVYWRGTHWRALQRQVETLCGG